MKKTNNYILFALLAATISHHLSTSAGAVGAAIEAGISTTLEQVREGLIALNEYNAYNHYNPAQKINYQAIAQFLDNEIKTNGLEPDLFRYFTGDQDWEVIKLSNGYGLIIPNSLPSDIDFISSLISSRQVTAAYPLNIQALNKLLASASLVKNQEQLMPYRLAIIKALVAAKTQGLLSGLANTYAQMTFAYLGNIAQTIHPNLEYVFTALAALYAQISSNRQWNQFQKNLDEYILNSIDIELIKTYITDLEQQLHDEKCSLATKLWGCMPSTSKTAKSALENRLEIIKNYLTDNDLELRLAERIRTKSKEKTQKQI